MKIETTTTFTLNESEKKAFKSLIDKVERHRANEGDNLFVSKSEAKVLVNLHNYFFEGIKPKTEKE